MIKKLLISSAALLVFLWGACTNLPSTHAAVLETIDGMLFWNGDPNYPLWDSGNKFGSALDISSAYIVFDDGKRLTIAVSDVTINYTANTVETVSPIEFKEQGGTVYLCFPQTDRCLQVKGKMMNDAYYYLKTCLGKN